MRIDIVTLFPGMFDGFIKESIVGRAIENKLVDIRIVNLRDYSKDKHLKVDDTPYGGGAGMVLMCQPVFDCLKALKTENSTTIMMTPQGHVFHQRDALDLALKEHLILLCGHYEGFDERIRSLVDLELSIGDYVLTGGEVPAMAITDGIVRLLDGVIERESYKNDSHYNWMLEHPQYTKPREYEGMMVPEVLFSGNHKEIERYKRYESFKRTLERRPDLLKGKNLNDEEMEWLDELQKR